LTVFYSFDLKGYSRGNPAGCEIILKMKKTTEKTLPEIGTKLKWPEKPQNVWTVDAILPTLNQFEAYLNGDINAAARFDLSQLRHAIVLSK